MRSNPGSVSHAVPGRDALRGQKNDERLRSPGAATRRCSCARATKPSSRNGPLKRTSSKLMAAHQATVAVDAQHVDTLLGSLMDAHGNSVDASTLPPLLLLYFAAYGSPASMTFHAYFVPTIAPFCTSRQLAVVYISADRAEKGFHAMHARTPFLTLAYPLPRPLTARVRSLRATLGLAQLPSLVVLRGGCVVTVRGASLVATYGAIAVQAWVRPMQFWWGLEWMWTRGGRALWVHAVAVRLREVVAAEEREQIGTVVIRRGSGVSGVVGVFRVIVRVLFGVGAGDGRRPTVSALGTSIRRHQLEQHQRGQVGDKYEDVEEEDDDDLIPATLTRTRLRDADGDTESIFPDKASLFSDSSVLTATPGMSMTRASSSSSSFHLFPSPLDAHLHFPTPPTSPATTPIPILKKTTAYAFPTVADNSQPPLASSMMSMSTVSLDASMIDLNQSMLASSLRRDSFHSQSILAGGGDVSPDASLVMSESMLGEFRKRKVSFSQAIGDHEESGDEGEHHSALYIRSQPRRESLSGSMVVIDRIWDIEEEGPEKDGERREQQH
ncbi:hypothetical protein BC830DRAFT_1169387 [Chytriomyces sp. MP71]|nr:hypothetical protein BC830DRAFT_1169387 [Chytriomyces sp. MP71]